MNANQLAKIAETLVRAVVDAQAYPKEHGINQEFRELVRHVRELHSRLVVALNQNEHLLTDRLRGLRSSTDDLIEQLEALAKMPDGKPPA
jgi:hypothetical protein